MDIVGQPVTRLIDDVSHCFDTEDCARLYCNAYDAGMLDEVLADQPEHRVGLLKRLGLHLSTAYFVLDGMWCASCARVAEKVIKKSEGVVDAQVSFAAGKARIDYDPHATDIKEIVRRVEKLGYTLTQIGTDESAKTGAAEERLLIQVFVAFAFGMQVMLIYIVKLYGAYSASDYVSQVRWIQYLAWFLATPTLFFGGQTFLRGALQEIKAHIPGMDTLVVLGTFSAYFYSVWASLVGGYATYFDSVAMIVSFVVFGRYIEMAGGARARKDVRGLMELQPDRAWVRSSAGSLEQLPAWQIRPGATIVIKPGERVPLDASVVEGGGHTDESLLTGESASVSKRPGDGLWAGTLLLDGSLTAKVERDVDHSRLSSIRALVETTLTTRAPAERLADTASLYLTLGVITLALVTGIGWLIAGASPSHALITAVAVLVVACPCALGLATPLAVSIALGVSAREGVLVRNNAALETASQTTAVAFDKTGTVTLGKLQVAAVGGSGVGDESLLCMAAAVEQYSEHPLARAIVSACSTPPLPVRDFTSQAGLGVSAVLQAGDIRVSIGRLDPDGMVPDASLSADAEAHAVNGETVVWVRRGSDASAEEILGFIALRDELDPSAPAAVRELRDRGMEPMLLSGDSAETTHSVASELGIERFQARLTPEDKAAYIAKLQSEGARVAMIGDGVNDAPSLATADLSITAAGGADVAGETSDIVLSRRDLELVPWFLTASARTRRTIRQNLGWAIAYNSVTLPLAALGVITPGIAAATMACSSLIVVGNSLRLRHQLRRIDAEKRPVQAVG